MGNLTHHARTELTRIGEEPQTVDWYCRVIRVFEEFGHSGASASVAIPTLNALLNFKNLSPLTSDPDEWVNHSEISGCAMWQNSRNSEAFSDDGGRTYWLLSEGGHSGNRAPRHESVVA